MSIKKQPYVGLTGFMSGEEVGEILELVPQGFDKKIMVGVLASTTTIMRKRPQKFPVRYPELDKISGIFYDHPNAFNVIHFNDSTEDESLIVAQLCYLVGIAGKNLHGFQLNIKWPKPDILAKVLSMFPRISFILQIGREAYNQVRNSPELLANKIRNEYLGLIDYVLFDMSGGNGIVLDVMDAKRVIKELTSFEDHVKIGVAGGLGPDNLDDIMPLFDYYLELSFDAEGKLRDADNEDKLNIERSKKYIKNGIKILSRYRRM